jgi:CelD/BcsL family acetyltransferase involved in cellulose biosynthesis
MIEVLIQPLTLDEHIQAEWRYLDSRAKSSFFVSWDWADALLATLPAKHSLSLLRLSDKAETVGLACIGKESALRHVLIWSKRLHFNSPGDREFNCLTTEDNMLVAQPGLEKACWNAILAWFAEKQNLADEFVFPGLLEPLDKATVTRHGLRSNNLPLRSYHVDLKRLEATNGHFDELLSKNARYQLRRSIRDFGGSSALKLVEAKSAKEALIWFDHMKALHIDSWSRRRMRHAFSRPFFETFHRNLIQRTFSAGRIQMLRVDANGNPIGYLYNFRDGMRTYAYQSGFADKNPRLRPGAVSHALAIEYNFRLGVGVYDFLTGANRLKSSFATDYRQLHWTTIQLPRVRFRLEDLARHAMHKVSLGGN